MFKEDLIKDLSIIYNMSILDIKLIIDQYENFILNCIKENPDKVIHIPNLGKFVVKLGRKKHWERVNEARGLSYEEHIIMKKEEMKKKER